MKKPTRFPLLAKVLGWLMLHLLILGLAFFLFVKWQLGMGLDSLLSGSAGERLGAFGDAVASRIGGLDSDEWSAAINALAREKNLTAALLGTSGDADLAMHVPSNIAGHARSVMPPPRRDPGPPGPPDGDRFEPPSRPPPPHEFDDNEVAPRAERGPRLQVPQANARMPGSKPVFLMRADNGDGYWAGVLLHLAHIRGRPPQPAMLLVRSDRLDGSGMFFDFKPWLWGGLAVLLLSLAFWAPLVWRMTRYLQRLTSAADRISSGQFEISLPPGGNDELGNLGRTIEAMAARLDHLVSSQKRFLGDAAHELCAPLARIRTGLGILEMRSEMNDSAALSSIEADVAELATLVNEILAFSRSGSRSLSMRDIELEPLVREVVSRESAAVDVGISIPAGLSVRADPALLGRAIGNLIRNADIHAGPRPGVMIEAVEAADAVSISVTDDGPGVASEELYRIFEPFYRIDRSRSRDTGGSGLGLAIVRSAIETCGGEVIASLPDDGGFRVTLYLPK